MTCRELPARFLSCRSTYRIRLHCLDPYLKASGSCKTVFEYCLALLGICQLDYARVLDSGDIGYIGQQENVEFAVRPKACRGLGRGLQSYAPLLSMVVIPFHSQIFTAPPITEKLYSHRLIVVYAKWSGGQGWPYSGLRAQDRQYQGPFSCNAREA